MSDDKNDSSDIERARRKRRSRSGWTLEEIKKNAERELKKFQDIAKGEPPELSSGDMDKIIRGEEDEDDEK